MEQLDKKLFIKTMAGLCELYQQEASELVINIYYEIFKDYDIEKFDRAVMDCIKIHKYNSLPKPAMILESLQANFLRPSNDRYIPNNSKQMFEPVSEEDQEMLRKMISDTVKSMGNN